MPRLTDFPEADTAFDKRLDSNSTAPIALALSGGGDSMALLYVAETWARRAGRRLLALTVDHGLNPDSAAWTAVAGVAAKTAGADWRSLAWTGEKPTAGLPAAARVARHRLLAEAARDAGAAVILFAHTADDVLESDFMRAETPALGHLKEWSPSPVWPEGRGMFAFRPLLGVRRATLRSKLRMHSRPWLEDPANDDIRFARPRARVALAGTSLTPRVEASADHALIGLATMTAAEAYGTLSLSRSSLAEATEMSARRFLSIAVICASGRSSPPRGKALDGLLSRVKSGELFIASLGGARIEASPARVTFVREVGDIRRAALPPISLSRGQDTIWDGRFEIQADTNIVVGPLAGSAARLSKSDRARFGEIPAIARPSLPALFDAGGIALPRPFGDGPAQVRALAGERLAAACGLVIHERDISPSRVGWGMAQGGWSSYVEALALA